MPQLNIHQIRKILPHRYPFLLVDRVEDIEYGKTIHAIKNVTVNEPCLQGISLNTLSCQVCSSWKPWRKLLPF